MARLALHFALLLAGAMAGAGASAQGYPDRPIRLVVGYAAGGGTDILARQVAPHMGALLGKQVLVENRPGAGANIAAMAVGSSTPDGYTLLIGDIALAVNSTISPDLPDPMKQLEPVALLANAPLVLVVHPSVGASSVDELVKLARRTPGKLSYGAASGANPTSLAPEVFKQVAGVSIVGVPYKGAGPALVDTIGGQVSMMFTGPSSAKPHIDAGRVRALAVTMKTRVPGLPGVPTFAEAGLALPDLDDGSWWGVLAPAGTPAEVKDRLQSVLKQVMSLPALQASLDPLTIRPHYADGRAFGEFIRSQTGKWARLIRNANIKPN